MKKLIVIQNCGFIGYKTKELHLAFKLKFRMTPIPAGATFTSV